MGSEGVSSMETSPLLKDQRKSETAFTDEFTPDNGGMSRVGQGAPYSRAAVFAVFFFPALGGLLFG